MPLSAGDVEALAGAVRERYRALIVFDACMGSARLSASASPSTESTSCAAMSPNVLPSASAGAPGMPESVIFQSKLP